MAIVLKNIVKKHTPGLIASLKTFNSMSFSGSG
jgi:hypothetical protein